MSGRTRPGWSRCTVSHLAGLLRRRLKAHHHHGLHFFALTDERGRLIRISAARPGRTHKLSPGQKTADRFLAVGRAPVEHGFARLNSRRALAKLRTDPARATRLLRALLVLTKPRSQPLTVLAG